MRNVLIILISIFLPLFIAFVIRMFFKRSQTEPEVSVKQTRQTDVDSVQSEDSDELKLSVSTVCRSILQEGGSH